MELKTKFNIGDEVYYIDKSRNSGVLIDKYKIERIEINKNAFSGIYNFDYHIYCPRMAQNRHSVSEDDIYSLDDIDKLLKDIRQELE